MDKRYFSEKIVEWYAGHRRDLPWRATDDPYKIWLSEVILQQTRVSQGLPYYSAFVQRFPDVFSLAAAPEEEVLRLWQGLGYYTRARNLHRCAKHVVAALNGVFPSLYEELITLPGIGDYTAAAIASFSSRQCVPVVDGNVFRVLARTHGIDTAINSPEGRKTFRSLAASLIDCRRPDTFNQALMEFGALWCTPRQPKCEQCPLRTGCAAFALNHQHLLPVKTAGRKPRKRYFYYFVVRKGKSIMMKRRADKDIWKGLYDFYLIEKPRAVKPEKLLAEDDFLRDLAARDSLRPAGTYRHLLSHQTIITSFFLVESSTQNIIARDKALKYYSRKKVDALPKPVLINRFLEDFDFL